jgi:hypothetical protein
MQDINQFENEIVEVAVTEILDAEERHAEPITICVAATNCAVVTKNWND